MIFGQQFSKRNKVEDFHLIISAFKGGWSTIVRKA